MTSISIIIPVKDEGSTIKKVIENLQEQIPDALICICDNGSTDNTVENVEKTMEIYPNVRLFFEDKKGKGNAVKKILNSIDTDIFCFVDGDLTYDTKNIAEFVNLIKTEEIDLINVKRIAKDKNAFKLMRKFGNYLYNKIFNFLYKSPCTDILSGYKLINKKFLKTFELKSKGFEIETELHIFAAKNNAKVKEVTCNYYPRAKNSKSKLHFFNDGINIFNFLLREYFKK